MLTKSTSEGRRDCTPEEEADIRAGWAEFEAGRPAKIAKENKIAAAKTLLKSRPAGVVTRAEFNALLDILDL